MPNPTPRKSGDLHVQAVTSEIQHYLQAKTLPKKQMGLLRGLRDLSLSSKVTSLKSRTNLRLTTQMSRLI